jgi:hypothetical protein
VPPSAYRMAGHAQQRQNGSYHEDKDADCPDDCDLRDEPDDEKNDAKNYQLRSLGSAAISRRGTVWQCRTRASRWPGSAAAKPVRRGRAVDVPGSVRHHGLRPLWRPPVQASVQLPAARALNPARGETQPGKTSRRREGRSRGGIIASYL